MNTRASERQLEVADVIAELNDAADKIGDES
jgi:hypothetical protein